MWYNNYVPAPGIFELLKKLKLRFKLGIISGNIKERIEFLDKKFDFRKYFDAEVYSFDLHTNKPDKIMWTKALELLNLEAEECVYLDDNIEAVNIANSLGFKAIQFKEISQAKRELSELIENQN
jgi:HAD superfamily hydrolase (TIGR01509 family)